MNSAVLLKSHVCIRNILMTRVNSSLADKKENIMNSKAIKSLAICVLGVATIAGCASSPPSQTVASSQGNAQRGKVTAVETVAVIDQSLAASSSGSSTVVTTASGGPSVITVQFNDGSQGKYLIERPMATHKVGESVYVVSDKDSITIVPQ